MAFRLGIFAIPIAVVVGLVLALNGLKAGVSAGESAWGHADIATTMIHLPRPYQLDFFEIGFIHPDVA